MIEQFWFGKTLFQLCGVLRKPDQGTNCSYGVIFFHGFGLSKCGPAFLFSRIAHQISQFLPTLQFDYSGWGDSEGETSDCTLETLFTDSQQAVDVIQRKGNCTHLIFIGHGFGNWIATMLGKRYPESHLALILPYKCPITPFEFLEELYWHQTPPDRFIDTSTLGDWELYGPLYSLFQNLGGNLPASKGVIIRWQFLKELLSMDSQMLLSNYPGSVLEIRTQTGESLLQDVNQRSEKLPYPDIFLTDPRNSDFIERTVVAWIKNLIDKK